MFTPDEIGHWLGLPDVVAWLAEAAGAPAGYADLTERESRTRFWLDLRVLSERAAAGLLEVAEARAVDRARPGALLRTIVSTGDAAETLLAAAGYRLIRHDLEMDIDLAAGLPAPQWPAGVEVRTFCPGDERTVWEAGMDAFADHWEYTPEPFDRWAHEHLERPGFDPTLLFLPLDGERVTGLCLCLVKPGDEPLGWIQILGVRPPWRRRGLGLALLRHSFHEFRARGLDRAGLEVDGENVTGAVRLYERAGMRVSHRTETYEKVLGAPRV
jgi:mycothiol synthase